MNTKVYRGEQIDMVISLGSLYYTGRMKKKIELKDSQWRGHRRAVSVGHKIKVVYDKFNPVHINLCVDVNKWHAGLSEVFGKKPDYYITEDEMGWYKILFYHSNKAFNIKGNTKREQFFFAGGAKDRECALVDMIRILDIKKIIAGAGWRENSNIEQLGFIPFKTCLQKYIQSKYTVVLQTEEGNNKGWITGRYFMNIGCQCIGFVFKEYDRFNKYIPKDSVLRIHDGRDMKDKINNIGYEKLLKIQNDMIQKDWYMAPKDYVSSFVKKINEYKT